MKTEVFSFNELNVDGNRDYAQIIIQVTGSDFDYSSSYNQVFFIENSRFFNLSYLSE